MRGGGGGRGAVEGKGSLLGGGGALHDCYCLHMYMHVNAVFCTALHYTSLCRIVPYFTIPYLTVINFMLAQACCPCCTTH